MLFRDTKKLAEYANILATATNFISLKSTLDIVEEQYLVSIIGRELYARINTAFSLITNEDTLSAADKALLHQCRRVIGPLLCYEYAPKSDVQLSDVGMRRTETSTNKTAFQEQRSAFIEANLNESERAVELLLEFIEANKSDYPEWEISLAYDNYSSLLIKTGKEFSSLVPTSSPYRNYMAMKSKMADVEDQISDTIYPGLFDYIKTTVVLSTVEKKLLVLLKKAIAYQTVGLSIPVLNVRIDGNGLTIMSNSTATSDKQSKRVAAGDTAVSSYMRNMLSSGKYYIERIQKHINENKSVYASFALSMPPLTNDFSNENMTGAFGLF